MSKIKSVRAGGQINRSSGKKGCNVGVQSVFYEFFVKIAQKPCNLKKKAV